MIFLFDLNLLLVYVFSSQAVILFLVIAKKIFEPYLKVFVE